MRRFITLLLGFAAISATKAQQGAHLSFSPIQLAAQQYQPAYLAADTASRIAVAGEYVFGLQTNALPLQQFLQFQGKKEVHLTESLIRSLVSDMGAQQNRFNQAFQLGGMVNFRVKKQHFSVEMRRRQWLEGALGNRETIGLLLLGNAAYAGKEVAENALQARFISGAELALGYAFAAGKWQIGLRAKAFRGEQLLDVAPTSFSLYTAPQGEYLDIAANYAFYQNTKKALGGALDIGIVREISPKCTLQFSATDIGAVAWTTDKTHGSFAKTRFEGLNVSNFIGNQITNGDSVIQHMTDSLGKIFLPDTLRNTRRTTYMLATLRLGASYVLNQRSRLHALASYAPLAISPTPCVSVAYHYDVLSQQRATVGANIFGGGVERYGAGLFLQTNLPLTQRLRLRIAASADSFGLFSPKTLHGLAAHLTAGLSW